MNCPNCFKPLDTSLTSCDRCGWQISPGMCVPRAEHERIVAEKDAEIARLNAEAEKRDEQIAEMIEASGQTCACGYDYPQDVCLGHLPHFRKSVAAAERRAYERAAEVAEKFDGFQIGAAHWPAHIAAAIRALKGG